jgi:hypothetical protein
MKRDDNILEEDDMLVSKWHSETRNNRSQNIEKLCSAIEFVRFVDK